MNLRAEKSVILYLSLKMARKKALQSDVQIKKQEPFFTIFNLQNKYNIFCKK